VATAKKMPEDDGVFETTVDESEILDGAHRRSVLLHHAADGLST
jgi:hypothetical protein